MGDQVRIVWQGREENGVTEVLGRIDTSVSGILQTLGELGQRPDDFNNLIVGEPKFSYKKLPCHIFIKSKKFDVIISKLREMGRCQDV